MHDEIKNWLGPVSGTVDPKKNTLISIGWKGDKRCYLNVSKEEAIKRYVESEGMTTDKVIANDFVDEFEFDDEFGSYAVYSINE
ncbi:MAG TPA: hypothetical protein V6C57_06660 [Coleofasciculaceae cyanobacterium]